MLQEQEINQLKTDIRHHEALLHVLDKKSERLEQAYNYQHELLEKIEENIDKNSSALKDLKESIDQHNGAADAKGKIHNNLYMWLTFLVLLVGNDAFWRWWGK